MICILCVFLIFSTCGANEFKETIVKRWRKLRSEPSTMEQAWLITHPSRLKLNHPLLTFLFGLDYWEGVSLLFKQSQNLLIRLGSSPNLGFFGIMAGSFWRLEGWLEQGEMDWRLGKITGVKGTRNVGICHVLREGCKG